MIALVPSTLQFMPQFLSRLPITVPQPPSTTPVETHGSWGGGSADSSCACGCPEVGDGPEIPFFFAKVERLSARIYGTQDGLAGRDR